MKRKASNNTHLIHWTYTGHPVAFLCSTQGEIDMITLTLFTAAAILIGFFGGTFWLASAVAGLIFAKLYPMVAILIVLVAIGLVAVRRYWRGRNNV